MARAVCKTCGAHWIWRAGRGRRLADLKCTDCGGELRQRARSDRLTETADFDFERYPLAFDLGTSREIRLARLREALDDLRQAVDDPDKRPQSVVNREAMVNRELDRMAQLPLNPGGHAGWQREQNT